MNAAKGVPVFAEITRRFMESGFFPGAVLRVRRGGRILHEEAWGRAVVQPDDGLPMAASTIFDLASVTKLFTTTAVLRLITEGRLRLDTDVADSLEGPSGLRESLEGVDVEKLLTHSSGIPWWYPFYARRSAGDRGTFLDVLAEVLKEHPRSPGVVYSDLGFMILGVLIERITGMDLPRALDALVLRPLGLGRTSFRRPRGPAAATEAGNRIERRMVAEKGLEFDHWRDESRPIVGEPNDGNTHYFFHGAAGHAGLFGDAADLCRLGQLYVEAGRIDGREWLAPGLVEDAFQDHGDGRGLGFQLGDPFPPGTAGHTGFTGTCLLVGPAAGIAAALLTNRLHVPEPRDIKAYRREMLREVAQAFGPASPPEGVS